MSQRHQLQHRFSPLKYPDTNGNADDDNGGDNEDVTLFADSALRFAFDTQGQR